MMNTKQIRLVCILAISVVLPFGRSLGAELSAQQRKIADSLVGKRIAEIQTRIVKDVDLAANIKQLARREKKWQGWQPAMRIGFCVRECRDLHVPIPAGITKEVVDDIIWQYENAYGDGNDLKYHREECARALGFIGNPKGIPTILNSLEQEGGHFSWAALAGPVADERFIAAIEKHLDLTCQQDAFPAIKCLERIGAPSISTLQRFLEGEDRALQRGAVNAFVNIGISECLPVLEDLRKAGNRKLATKAEAGILRIRCRAIDKIYSPPIWKAEDDARLRYLTSRALFDEDPKVRSQASAALVDLGASGVWHLRLQLPNYSHGDGPSGAHFFISERASELLVQIGKPAIPALIDALGDEYQHGRGFAAQALQQITGETFGPEYEKWKTWYLQKEQRKSTQQKNPPDKK